MKTKITPRPHYEANTQQEAWAREEEMKKWQVTFYLDNFYHAYVIDAKNEAEDLLDYLPED